MPDALPNAQEQGMRTLGTLIDNFFKWVEVARQNEQGHTKLSQALGYAHNQE